jgi:hypothetical protein
MCNFYSVDGATCFSGVTFSCLNSICTVFYIITHYLLAFNFLFVATRWRHLSLFWPVPLVPQPISFLFRHFKSVREENMFVNIIYFFTGWGVRGSNRLPFGYESSVLSNTPMSTKARVFSPNHIYRCDPD